MRLLKRHSSDYTSTSSSFSLTEFRPSNIPSKYAILSHRWGDDEITLKDLESGIARSKPGGYRKLDFCAAQAAHDGIDYFWIDTCCINKESSAELSEAINSMFKWYQNAAKCYVYLPDVALDPSNYTTPGNHAWTSAFRASAWFTRGWTLQELVAPKTVDFFSVEGRCLGSRASLEEHIHYVTKIPVEALRGSLLSTFTTDERFAWAATRYTTIEEDAAYCLLGLFDIQMPLLYGEGGQKALARLRRKVEKSAQPISSKVTNPLQTVPFERNPRFTGRETELAKLEAQLFASHHTSTWAITGLGGIGKTQLVLEFLYRTQAKQPDCVVLWIPAASRESLHQGYAAVARQLNIPGCADKDADIEVLVQNHLSNLEVGRWLLVFDNADDISLWTTVSASSSQKTKPIQQDGRLIDRLPRNKRGCIMFTTRDRKLATKLAGPNVISVTEIGREAAVELFGNYLGDSNLVSDQGQHVARLLEELTHLPLAIVQAATYINENGITIAEYLQLLDEKEEEVINLLSADFEDHGRYRDVKNPITTTWLISFEQIKKHDQLAAEYLSFMACIHPKDIPQSLLRQGPSRQKELEAIGTLTAYSFVSRRSGSDLMTLHRLVHLATRNWLRKEGTLDSWLEQTVVRLEEVFPDKHYLNRNTWRMYLPHALQVLGPDGFSGTLECRAALMTRCGRCLHSDGRYNEAEMLFSQALVDESPWSTDKISSQLYTKYWLARVYQGQGRWTEAAQLQTKVLEMSKTIQGSDHLDTLPYMDTLAQTYQFLGRWREAEELQVKVIEMRKTQLGTDQTDALRSMYGLAVTFSKQGRWTEAEELLVEVSEKWKTQLGADHEGTLASINELASTISRQGRSAEAEKLQVELMEKRKMKLGPDHPDTLSSMSNLAIIFRDQGRWIEAEATLLEVIEGSRRKQGPDHPTTLTAMANLTLVYADQHRLVEAEELSVQVLEARKRMLGMNHPDTLWSMNNLAVQWKALGRDEEAIQLMKERVQRSAEIIGVQHPYYLLSVKYLREWETERLFAENMQHSIQTKAEITVLPPGASTLITQDVKDSTGSSSSNRQQKIKLSYRIKNLWRSGPNAKSSPRA